MVLDCFDLWFQRRLCLFHGSSCHSIISERWNKSLASIPQLQMSLFLWFFSPLPMPCTHQACVSSSDSLTCTACLCLNVSFSPSCLSSFCPASSFPSPLPYLCFPKPGNSCSNLISSWTLSLSPQPHTTNSHFLKNHLSCILIILYIFVFSVTYSFNFAFPTPGPEPTHNKRLLS